MSLNEVMMYKVADPKKPKILLLTSTGVVAVYINETIIHAGLQKMLGVRCFN